MAANLFNRYVWLLDKVSSYNGITFEQIDEAWQRSCLNEDGTPLPKRTLHNHINAIETMFGLRVVCRRQGGYKYYIEGSDGNKLSDAQEWVLSYLRMSNALMDSSHLQGRILLDKTMMYRFLNPILTAMQESRRVILCCPQRIDEERLIQNYYHFEPYFVKQYKEWYVVGRVVEDDTVHIFSFCSIAFIEALDEKYIYPKDFSVTEFLDNIPLLAKEGTAQIDDREDFIKARIDDKRCHRSRIGRFIPDEVIK